MSHDTSLCPLGGADKRLNDAHQLWHQADQSYFEPDPFRLAAQNAIQVLRSVTFLLQKNKSLIPDFDSWYGTNDKRGRWQKRLADIPLMRWLVEARNHIEKEGDLATQSFIRAQVIASHLDEGPRIDVPAKLFDSPAKLLSTLPADVLQHVRKNGFLRIERRWVADSLPDWELLEALAAAYGHLAELVHDAHTQMGLPSPAATDVETGETYDAASLGWRLPCMIRHAEPRATDIDLSDGSLLTVERRRVKPPSDARETLTERYGIDPEKFFAGNPTVIEQQAAKLFELARTMFLRDRHHIAVVFLLRNGFQICVMQMDVEDRKQKYVRSRLIGDEVAKSGADCVVMIGESWLAPQKALGPYEFPADLVDREEALTLNMVSKSGAALTLMAKIRRDGGNVSLDETRQMRGGTFFGFAPTLSVWGIPVAPPTEE